MACYIKAYYGTWKPVSKEKALQFASCIFLSILPKHSEQKKAEIANRHVKGIRFTPEELKWRQ